MTDPRAAKHITIRGVVQGVGFRPFVYRLAHEHGLTGWVLNHSRGVEIEVEGAQAALSGFVEGLEASAPPLARIEALEVRDAPLVGHAVFEIRHSVAEEGSSGEAPPLLISPDIATCPDCLRELLDPADRRHRYPFTNCTNCGPRFTIIADIPYDRPLTTMRHFPMCPLCQGEYENPLDRRFHAQPNACPDCGPHVWLERSSHSARDDHGVGDATQPLAEGDGALRRAGKSLKEGAVLAIKGLGGFHLACDATDELAVARLRQRKGRPAKPLAVMMATLEEVQAHCWVSPEERRLLTSPQCPIVLLCRKPTSTICRLVAPGNNTLGVMLPYTPLHHVLLRDVARPLVMTSGNLSEEPIAQENDEARQRLGHLADFFLMHNRDIYARYDDSVWFVPAKAGARPDVVSTGPQAANAPQPVRRSRGYAPFPVRLPSAARQVLACGAELKNTFCVTRGEYGFLSQHIGDLENLETLVHFENSIELYKRLFRIQPEIVAHDMHPEYLATKYAKRVAIREATVPSRITHHASLIPVQHHHAHIASCLVDNGWRLDQGPVIGVAWDGTGYGTDGHIWGGEFLVADMRSFRRAGHLELLPMPGGEIAIRNPYRLALGYLYALRGEMDVLPSLDEAGGEERDIIRQQVERGINCPQTTAGGRLFDAVSALLGVCSRASYEAQAAIELEMAASSDGTASLIGAGRARTAPYPFGIGEDGDAHVIRLRDLFQALLEDLERGTPTWAMAYRFHVTVAEMMRAVCQRIAADSGLQTVALSGGCFQNRLLLALVVPLLREAGFEVLLHHQVPCNDGGISLGQAVIANASAEAA